MGTHIRKVSRKSSAVATHASRRSAMHMIRTQCGVRWAFAAVCLAALTNSATAGSFTRACAARDMQLLKLIEEHENTNAISTEKSTDALLTIMHARMVCFE